MEVGDLAAHLLAKLSVQIRQRLVVQEEIRLQDEHSRERDALLFATAEVLNAPILVSRQGDDLQDAGHLLLQFVLREVATVAQPERDVVEHRHMREQRQPLEHEAHVPVLRCETDHLLARNDDLAVVGFDEPRD